MENQMQTLEPAAKVLAAQHCPNHCLFVQSVNIWRRLEIKV